MARREPVQDAPDPFEFLDETAGEARRQWTGQLLRWGIAFALLFAGVFFCFWWSGAAIRFGAARVGDTPVATWRVIGAVRSAATQEPVPWAAVADDPGGRPPFFRTDANYSGGFSLLTLAEPHTIRVEASGFLPATVQVGRPWFIWWPRGEEHRDILLTPE